MLRKHTNIVVHKDDLTRYNCTFDGRFNFIKAANVLNKGHLADAALMTILENIRRYLTKPKGALLIIRTHAKGVSHGTLFNIEENGGCKIQQRFGQGSEVEDIVDECMRRL